MEDAKWTGESRKQPINDIESDITSLVLEIRKWKLGIGKTPRVSAVSDD